MRPRLIGLYTLEMERLREYRPQDLECFEVCVRALIGEVTEGGEESFDIKVCSPKWLERECERDGFVSGRHRLIFSSFDPTAIEAVITKLISAISGESWTEVAAKLARMGYWEFGDSRHNYTIASRKTALSAT